MVRAVPSPHPCVHLRHGGPREGRAQPTQPRGESQSHLEQLVDGVKERRPGLCRACACLATLLAADPSLSLSHTDLFIFYMKEGNDLAVGINSSIQCFQHGHKSTSRSPFFFFFFLLSLKTFVTSEELSLGEDIPTNLGSCLVERGLGLPPEHLGSRPELHPCSVAQFKANLLIAGRGGYYHSPALVGKRNPVHSGSRSAQPTEGALQYISQGGPGLFPKLP